MRVDVVGTRRLREAGALGLVPGDLLDLTGVLPPGLPPGEYTITSVAPNRYTIDRGPRAR